MHKLSSDHVQRGSRHRNPTAGVDNDKAADEQLLQEFERNSEIYEEKVKQANDEKAKMRDEINQYEKEVRKMRDHLADKETENKNLNYLLDRESELSQEKAQREEQALRLLNDDLGTQLEAIEKSNDKTGGLVTPLRMEQLL